MGSSVVLDSRRRVPCVGPSQIQFGPGARPRHVAVARYHRRHVVAAARYDRPLSGGADRSRDGGSVGARIAPVEQEGHNASGPFGRQSAPGTPAARAELGWLSHEEEEQP